MSPAHPRVGGENSFLLASLEDVGGLIPAWAGKTRAGGGVQDSTAAHPRVGGENVPDFARRPCEDGSSPRGRGKLRDPSTQRVDRGLIPAWAGKTSYRRRPYRPRPAHPRVGGENAVLGLDQSLKYGSSPRGRGKRRRLRRAGGSRRLIPAWAGKTASAGEQFGGEQAHPRVGGENALRRRGSLNEGGSSPRGRGKRSGLDGRGGGDRLIPAWAGKTPPGTTAHENPRAHPRVGGENSGGWMSPRTGKGSSPRGRGKLSLTDALRNTGRLIPAWAGKTQPHRGRPRTQRAHPRVGGENRSDDGAYLAQPGSSPRGRGKPSIAVPSFPASRLIPAWAGKTADDVGQRDSLEAHPRVGGENTCRRWGSPRSRGSSPRGRGKHLLYWGSPAWHGLIPAWAGKTRSTGLRWSSRTAHPRVGGENAWSAHSFRNVSGSSPRGRGKPAHRVLDAAPMRLIPAWAGKTDGPHFVATHSGAHPRVGGENGEETARAE